jgi:hypothetical protein
MAAWPKDAAEPRCTQPPRALTMRVHAGNGVLRIEVPRLDFLDQC